MSESSKQKVLLGIKEAPISNSAPRRTEGYTQRR